MITSRSPKGIISFAQGTSANLGSGVFIDGYVKKYGNSSFLFPVGDNGIYQPFGAAADGTVGAYYNQNAAEASLPAGAPFSLINKDISTLNQISPVGYWDIDGPNTTKLSLVWTANSTIGTLTGNTLSKLTVAGWNASTSRWEKIEAEVDAISLLGTPSTLTTGSITTSAAIVPSTYTIYALASTSSGPLPVTLTQFNADVNDAGAVELLWSTSFETNSEQFELQHSTDGTEWSRIGSVAASGESTVVTHYRFEHATPASGINYYRLQMIDKDLRSSLSRIQTVRIAPSTEIVLYPNPVSDRIFAREDLQKIIKNVIIHNHRGQSVFESNSFSASGINVSGLASGIYMVKIELMAGTAHWYKIVINK